MSDLFLKRGPQPKKCGPLRVFLSGPQPKNGDP